MTKFSITIDAPGLTEAIHHLANAIAGTTDALAVNTTTPAIVEEAPIPVAPQPAKAVSEETRAATQAAAPVAPASAPASAQPKNYTLDDLEAYEDAVPEGSLTPEQLFEMDKAAILMGGKRPTTLTDAEVGDLLIRGKELSKWLTDLQDYALTAILGGREIPGWKAVEGRSDRKFTDVDKVIEKFKEAGYDEAVLFERKPKTLTALEKLMGKKDFAEKIGSLIEKPPGKPTLVEASDKRAPYNPMAADAAGLK